MNNRLTIQDLAALLAEYTGKERASMERFLREFVAVISEGVIADKLVKVKGLGTFKIVPVEKRESIHVNTGERFVIPEHYKFSFLPDKELRELVNKPFSFFETTELSDSADFSDMDISEEEIEEKEVEDESVEEVIPEETLPESLLEEPQADEEPQTDEEAKAEVEAEPEVEPEVIPTPPEQEETVSGISYSQAEPEEPEEPEALPIRKSHHKTYLLVGILVILLAVINIVIYMNRNYFMQGNNPIKKNNKEMLSEVVSKLVEAPVMPDTILQKTDSHAVTSPQPPAEVRPDTTAATVEATTPDVIASIKIKAGDRLTLIALEQYGNKHFWVYLYEYNKAKIKDPNNVPIGTVIEVPAPRLYGIDAHNRASVEKAAARQTEILSGK